MQANRDDLATLLQLQQIDMGIARVNKELSELPQRKVIVAAPRARRGAPSSRSATRWPR